MIVHNRVREKLERYAELLAGAAKKALQENTILYRARSCTSEEEFQKVISNPTHELGTNIAPAKNDGRFHQKGEHPLYFSDMKEAAIAEVTSSETRHLVVGKFKTKRLTPVFSLIPQDYQNFFYQDNTNIHDLCNSLYEIAHVPDQYEHTKKFVQMLREKGFISEQDFEYGLFIIRYQSVKNPSAFNYFMCGANEISKLLGDYPLPEDDTGFLIPNDYDLLKFLGYEEISKPKHVLMTA